jgi:pyruvate,water dikinase
MELVCWLPDVGGDDTRLAGGKGANLGELLRAGLPVPPGFVLTTAAYAHVVAEAELQASIEGVARLAAAGDPSALSLAARDLRARLTAAPIAEELTGKVRRAYRTHADAAHAHAQTDPPVAVRSSATTEDLPGASFAGQQETLLNVRGEKALLEAIRGCWASLWTDRAIAYRQQQGIDQAGASVAVLVQRLVPADTAGVLFTADPVTGDASRSGHRLSRR